MKINRDNRENLSMRTSWVKQITGYVGVVLHRGKNSLYHPRWIQAGQAMLAIALMGFCLCALADGTDILQGTDASLWATLNGTGKKYIYAAEGILGLAAYMKTKNLLVLSGIVVVSIFFNIILSIAGESA